MDAEGANELSESLNYFNLPVMGYLNYSSTLSHSEFDINCELKQIGISLSNYPYLLFLPGTSVSYYSLSLQVSTNIHFFYISSIHLHLNNHSLARSR